MRKTAVYREVLRCPDCHHEVKARLLGKDFPEEVEMIDPDFGNEMNSIMLADAPFCMPLKGPSKNSVWYNQSGVVKYMLTCYLWLIENSILVKDSMHKLYHHLFSTLIKTFFEILIERKFTFVLKLSVVSIFNILHI